MNFIKNSCIDVNSINKQKIVIAPIKAPKAILFNDAFLFNKIETVTKRIKSKIKFKRNTISKYIFISSPIKL